MTLNIDLTNYRALIRGISSGIGRATYLNCVEITKHPSSLSERLTGPSDIGVHFTHEPQI